VVYRPVGFTPFELQCAQVYGHTRLYALPEGLRKLVTGRWVSAGLSFYAWKINRDWQKGNQPYLRELEADSRPLGPAGNAGSCPPSASGGGWVDVSRRPASALLGRACASPPAGALSCARAGGLRAGATEECYHATKERGSVRLG
jgi:hypothetical protein